MKLKGPLQASPSSWLFKMLSKRLQSTGSVSSFHGGTRSPLDLDFVLGLLDGSKGSKARPPTDSHTLKQHWSGLKFKVIERENTETNEGETTLKEDYNESFYGLDRETGSSLGNFSRLLVDGSSEGNFSRLQGLVDSLPNEIYDRHGNLTPLNTSRPPMSFFDMDVGTSAALSKQLSGPQTLPILQRDNFDWSSVSLTSILKKIVPEEVFQVDSTLEKTAKTAANTVDTNADIETVEATSKNISFTPIELRLLDSDQLLALAKHFRIVTDRQTDFKIEREILASQGQQPVTISTKNISKEKITWTAENEQLLMNIFDQVRLEKHFVDSKLQSILNHQNSSQIPLKRSKGSNERGVWAVVTDKFRMACKIHVSMTTCRNKLIILKRLKA